ncbi:GntR family transcriptional regulator [Parasphingopyxis lamellibrachiae]|uniref:GntR family transcriptional regulator n=1 Tax=Parasphingopyxis lamellibrachiae TaxID=680125 RepID=A0A3D9FG80_9SPHN|nr:GntR family transcriptional regulator [Parasphingopyxis lamellibrachiae]RED16773.1 GntR family transcriptional regulator [Parasphingopyxis lamellibrachiae]
MTGKTDSSGAVDRMQAVPLYHQIFLQLREEITSGERAFGSRLPTEQELSKQFAVSRITARRALDELAENQLVERKRRVGTHVIFRSPARPIQGNIEQALESLLNFGRATQVKLLEVDTVPAHPPIDEALDLPTDTPVLRVVRDRWLDGAPLGHFVSYIPSDLGEAMTRAKLKTTPMLTLLEDAGAQIGAAHQTISATLADATVSASLQIDIGSPILRVSRTVLDVNERPVQHILAQFRPDRYQIRLDLNSPRGMEPQII